ncbi:hypothetical protein COO60DRAFT_1645177 [Scenedesmus sp. NREL 46B-D3]|nr:hypothetical protein COO60DRAFT_1645177 [Scenedesmus sp. NREL 46B-D3]
MTEVDAVAFAADDVLGKQKHKRKQKVIETDIGGSTELSEPVPINTNEPVPYESELFKGTVHLHIRGLGNTHEGKFEGKKRFLHIAFQGRFKRDVKASDFWSGHEWFNVSDLVPTSVSDSGPAPCGPSSIRTAGCHTNELAGMGLDNTQASWRRNLTPHSSGGSTAKRFVNIGYTAAAKMFSSTTRVCPSTSNGQVAGFLNPVLASSQLVNVAVPGQEPTCNPMTAEKRRRWFDSPANAGSVVLSKDYVYTYHVWQHWCNISTYRLQLSSLLSLDLCQFSEGQPMQIMAKDQSVIEMQRLRFVAEELPASETGEYSINLLLWHKRLLFNDPPSEQHSLRGRLTNGVSSLRASWKGMLANK